MGGRALRSKCCKEEIESGKGVGGGGRGQRQEGGGGRVSPGFLGKQDRRLQLRGHLTSCEMLSQQIYVVGTLPWLSITSRPRHGAPDSGHPQGQGGRGREVAFQLGQETWKGRSSAGLRAGEELSAGVGRFCATSRRYDVKGRCKGSVQPVSLPHLRVVSSRGRGAPVYVKFEMKYVP